MPLNSYSSAGGPHCNNDEGGRPKVDATTLNTLRLLREVHRHDGLRDDRAQQLPNVLSIMLIVVKFGVTRLLSSRTYLLG